MWNTACAWEIHQRPTEKSQVKYRNPMWNPETKSEIRKSNQLEISYTNQVRVRPALVDGWTLSALWTRSCWCRGKGVRMGWSAQRIQLCFSWWSRQDWNHVQCRYFGCEGESTGVAVISSDAWVWCCHQNKIMIHYSNNVIGLDHHVLRTVGASAF